jgi:hypothetical protein
MGNSILPVLVRRLYWKYFSLTSSSAMIAMKRRVGRNKRKEWYRDVPRSPNRGPTSRVYKEPNFGI